MDDSPRAPHDEHDVGSPRQVSFLETLPVLSGVLGSRRTMQRSILNAATLLEGRVDPRLAALDQAIPTWVIRKAKARGRTPGGSAHAEGRAARGRGAWLAARWARLRLQLARRKPCARLRRRGSRGARAPRQLRARGGRARERRASAHRKRKRSAAPRRAPVASARCAAPGLRRADAARARAAPQGIAFMWVCKVRSRPLPAADRASRRPLPRPLRSVALAWTAKRVPTPLIRVPPAPQVGFFATVSAGSGIVVRARWLYRSACAWLRISRAPCAPALTRAPPAAVALHASRRAARLVGTQRVHCGRRRRRFGVWRRGCSLHPYS